MASRTPLRKWFTPSLPLLPRLRGMLSGNSAPRKSRMALEDEFRPVVRAIELWFHGSTKALRHPIRQERWFQTVLFGRSNRDTPMAQIMERSRSVKPRSAFPCECIPPTAVQRPSRRGEFLRFICKPASVFYGLVTSVKDICRFSRFNCASPNGGFPLARPLTAPLVTAYPRRSAMNVAAQSLVARR